jgi:uncharacterized protein (TIGR03067 family)
MSRLALVAALFSTAFLAVAAARADADGDLKALVGKWALVKGELGGKDVTEHLKDLDFRIAAGGKYTATVGKLVDEGSFTVDPTKTPKQMDIKTGKGGPSAGKELKAIYTLDGDALVICYQFGGGDRPAAFKSEPDTKQYLARYKRAK